MCIFWNTFIYDFINKFAIFSNRDCKNIRWNWNLDLNNFLLHLLIHFQVFFENDIRNKEF